MLYTLNEVYGEPQRASVLINGTPGIVFAWALPDSITYLTSSYMSPEVGDNVEISIYYPAVEEDTP
ncbi:MAG: hypothetical protein IKR04_07580 [Clostridia bacterium]|nr:hypothetical protein [Clostridia bacterium]